MVDAGIKSQIGEKRRAVMDALSENELRYEIELGPRSRFSKANIPYLKQRLAQIEDEEAASERAEDVSMSAKAYRQSWWAIVIAAGALMYSIFGPN